MSPFSVEPEEAVVVPAPTRPRTGLTVITVVNRLGPAGCCADGGAGAGVVVAAAAPAPELTGGATLDAALVLSPAGDIGAFGGSPAGLLTGRGSGVLERTRLVGSLSLICALPRRTLSSRAPL